MEEAREAPIPIVDVGWGAEESSQQLATAFGTGSLRALSLKLTGEEERMEETEGGLEEREMRPMEIAAEPPLAI